MADKFLDKAYSHEGGEAARRFYDEWAGSYDEEIVANGYATPSRCAEALVAAGADLAAPVLDFGCGTGLSGAALRAVGFRTIDGVDPSREMLRRAEPRRVYRMLREVGPEEELRSPKGLYRAITAVGVFGPGLAGPEAFDRMLAILPVEGLIAFSLNDHAIEDGAHLRRLAALIDAEIVSVVAEEDGAHLPKIDLGARVYVVKTLR